MRNSYPSKESVLKIDSGDYAGKFVFPSYASGGMIHQKVEAVLVGGMKGSRDPLVKAFDSADRNGTYSLLNVFLIPGYVEEVVDVPADIKTVVDKYNAKFPEYRKNQMDDSESLDFEIIKEMETMSNELNEYFEK